MKLHVVNWRCIEDLTIELAPITILIGRNSTGKSSLAYAAYFLAKLPRWRDTETLIQHLYGTPVREIIGKRPRQAHLPCNHRSRWLSIRGRAN